jgi:hypothetical protein
MALLGIFILLIIPHQIREAGYGGGIGATFVPYLLGFVIVGASVVSLITSVLSLRVRAVAAAEKKIVTDYKGPLKVVLVVVVISLWIQFMTVVGFIPMTAIAIVLHMLIMGIRKIIYLVLVPVITSLLLYYTFIFLLRVDV